MKYAIAFAVALMGSILGTALLLISIPVREWVAKTLTAWAIWLVAVYHDLRERIREARNPKPAPRKRPAPGETFDVLVPASAGPLVESSVSKDPLLLTQLPVHSTKADAKREAHRYAEKRAGRPLSWKAARKLLNAWGRDEREILRSMEPEYAAKMQELTGAAN